jgi:hypothetical protein
MGAVMFNRRKITLLVGVAIAILVWLSTDLFGMAPAKTNPAIVAEHSMAGSESR